MDKHRLVNTEDTDFGGNTESVDVTADNDDAISPSISKKMLQEAEDRKQSSDF